jgi:hypothetical protein
MLFLLVMEVLRAMIRKADMWSLFSWFVARGILHWAILYADDLIIFLSSVARDLELIRSIFNIFEGASSLACNMNKSEMTTIRCNVKQPALVANLLPCLLVQFPIKYLCIPLSVTKLPKSNLQPLGDKMIDTLPMWKGKLMNRSGRLTLIKTTLSAMSVFTVICLDLSA